MPGEVRFDSDIDLKGKLKVLTIPNQQGNIITWDTATKLFGARTNAEIKTDLALNNVNNTADAIKAVQSAATLRKVNINLAQLNSFDLEPGVYNIEGEAITELPGSYFHIIQTSNFTYGGHCAQIAIPYDTGINQGIYLRVGNYSDNGTWERQAKFSDIQSVISSTNKIHKINGVQGINNGSDNLTNNSWFEYNWANSGKLGSVINFSGLEGFAFGYATELFGEYNLGGNSFGVRTRDGDTAAWNPVRWLWHTGNFNPTDYVQQSSLTTQLLNYSQVGEKINAVTITGNANKTLTITKQNGTTLSANFTDNDTDYPDDVLNSLSFNNTNGTLTAVTSEGASITASLDGRYSLINHSHTYSSLTGIPTSFNPSAHTHTKAEVGLGNVDNTADIVKLVESARTLRNVNITLAQLNSVTLEPGIYNAENFAPNQGLNSLFHYIIQLGSYTGGGFRAQIAIPYQGGTNQGMYLRVADGASWGAWEKQAKYSDIQTIIDSNGLVTATTLSNYVTLNTGQIIIGSKVFNEEVRSNKQFVVSVPGGSTSGGQILKDVYYGEHHFMSFGFDKGTGDPYWSRGYKQNGTDYEYKSIHEINWVRNGIHLTENGPIYKEAPTQSTTLGNNIVGLVSYSVWTGKNFTQANINSWNDTATNYVNKTTAQTVGGTKTFTSPIKATDGVKSDAENPNTLFIPDGTTSTINKEIKNINGEVRIYPTEVVAALSYNTIDEDTRFLNIVCQLPGSTVSIRPRGYQYIKVYNVSSGEVLLESSNGFSRTLLSNAMVNIYSSDSGQLYVENTIDFEVY